MSWYCKAWPPGVRSCEATATRSRAVRSRPPTVSPLRPSPSGGRSFLLSPMLKSRYEGKDARVRDRCTAAVFLASPVGDRGEARSGAARSCARATRARGGACRERGERRTRGDRACSGRRNVLQELLAEGRKIQVVHFSNSSSPRTARWKSGSPRLAGAARRTRGSHVTSCCCFSTRSRLLQRARPERTRNLTRRISGCAARPVSMSTLSETWGPKRLGSRERSRR